MKIRGVSSKAFHRRKIKSGTQNFERVETTISHSLRKPSRLLRGATYGEALFHALERWSVWDNPGSVLEIGGGRGDLARDFMLAAGGLDYTILDLSPKLCRAQKRTLARAALTARHVLADVEAVNLRKVLCADWSGVVIANEMIADLDTWRLIYRREEIGKPIRPKNIEMVGREIEDLGSKRIARVLNSFAVHRTRTAKEVYFPYGLSCLLHNLHGFLADDAAVVITEYFSSEGGGEIVSLDGHQEVSYDLDLVCRMAAGLGFSVQVIDLVDLLDIRFDQATAQRRFVEFCEQRLGCSISPTLLWSREELPFEMEVEQGFAAAVFGRAEFMRFVGQFYALVLRKHRLTDSSGLTPEFAPRKNPAVVKAESRDGRVFLLTYRPFTFEVINETGEFLWSRIDGHRTIDDLARELSIRYAVAAKAALADTVTYTRGLLERDRVY